MASQKKIVDALNDDNGNIKAVRLEGNSTFTPLDTAIRMTESGRIDAVVVDSKNAKKHIRTKPDGRKRNNLDELAK